MPKNKVKKKQNRNRPRNRPRNATTNRRTNVSAPAAVGSIIRNRGGSLREIHVRHREYVAKVLTDSSGNYRKTFQVNPALDDTFPWLAGIAKQFESYNFRKLSILFTSSVGSDTNGSVAICPDYDADDDNTGLSLQRLYQFDDSVRFPVWHTAAMHCSNKNLHKRKCYYTRNSSVTTDLKDHDVCSVTVLASTGEVSTEIGELWVEYLVTLTTPQIPESEAEVAHILSKNVSAQSAPFSDTSKLSGLAEVAGKLKDHVKVATDTVLQFSKPGRYLIEKAVNNTLGALSGINTATTTKMTTIDSVPSLADSGNYYGGNATLIDVDEDTTEDDPAEYTWTGTTNSTGVPYSSIVITKLGDKDTMDEII